jgi:pimeloyl-ACP methyl ester carboxylesterase
MHCRAGRPSEILLALALAVGCGRLDPARGLRSAAPESVSDASAPAVTSALAAPAAPKQTPLTATESVIDLPLTGFLSAVATIPVGSSGPRPIAVAVHGMSDGPQWACPLWRGILGGGVFILCPRGVKEHDQPRGVTPGTTYYTFTTWEALDAEIEVGLAALHERFPGRLDDGPPLYVGFSLGARLGISIALAHPGRYPRLVLSEGGHDAWTSATAQRFAESGGARVLFACGDLACVAEAKPKVALLDTAGIHVKLVYGAGSGHQAYGPIFDETRKAIDSLFEGDPRWMNR